MGIYRQEKEQVVSEISNKLKVSQSIVVANYSRLTVKELQELRGLLAEKEVELKVYKNRLFKIAAKNANIEELNKNLVGQNIFAFNKNDEISAAKIILKFAEEKHNIKLVAGTFEGKVVDSEGIMEVAKLPSYEEALTILAMQLIAPIRYVGVGLNQLVEENLLTK